MTTPLAGKRAVVTGASRGIGEAIARSLSSAGATVHLLARSGDLLQRLAAELGGAAWPVDLRDDAEVWDTVERLREREGVPDIVVNAAGVFDLAPISETSVSVFDRNIQLNLRAPFLIIRAFLPEMLSRGAGDIVTIGSVAGRRTFPSNGAYCASKWGLRGFHEVLVEELTGSGVRACLVEPAATDTPIWDALDPDQNPHLPNRDQMLTPEDVAEAVRFVVTRPTEVRIGHLPIARG